MPPSTQHAQQQRLPGCHTAPSTRNNSNNGYTAPSTRNNSNGYLGATQHPALATTATTATWVPHSTQHPALTTTATATWVRRFLCSPSSDNSCLLSARSGGLEPAAPHTHHAAPHTHHLAHSHCSPSHSPSSPLTLTMHHIRGAVRAVDRASTAGVSAATIKREPSSWSMRLTSLGSA